MLDRISSDESLRVLLFVCLPLTVALIASIALLVRRSRRTATFPTFSVSISKVGQEEMYVNYRDQRRNVEFNALTKRGKSFFTPEIQVAIPNDMSLEEIREIVPKLAQGLMKIHYEYLIYRRLEPLIIPEGERNAAIAELRQMGIEVPESRSEGEVHRALVLDWRTTAAKGAEAVMPQILDLMSKARGLRENIEVLARSKLRK